MSFRSDEWSWVCYLLCWKLNCLHFHQELNLVRTFKGLQIEQRKLPIGRPVPNDLTLENNADIFLLLYIPHICPLCLLKQLTWQVRLSDVKNECPGLACPASPGIHSQHSLYLNITFPPNKYWLDYVPRPIKFCYLLTPPRLDLCQHSNQMAFLMIYELLDLVTTIDSPQKAYNNNGWAVWWVHRTTNGLPSASVCMQQYTIVLKWLWSWEFVCELCVSKCPSDGYDEGSYSRFKLRSQCKNTSVIE